LCQDKQDKREAVGPVAEQDQEHRRENGPRKVRRLTMVLLLGVLLGEVIFLLVLSPGEDFWQHYQAAHAIRRGIPLREMPMYKDGDWPYVYPGFTAVLLLPISFLPPRLAFTVWVGILYSATGLSTYLFATRVAGLDRQVAMLATIVSLVWPVTFIVVFLGQTTPLILMLLVVTYVLGERGRFYVAGLVLSLGLVKPHLVVPVVPGLMLRGKWRMVGSFVIGTLMLAGASLATGLNTSPNAWSGYILGWFLGGERSVSLTGYQLVSLPWRLLLAACGYCVLAVWWFKKDTILPIDAALAFLASLLLSPYVPAYDLVLLTPILALLISRRDAFFWLAMVLSSWGALRYGFLGLLTLSMGCFGYALLRLQRTVGR